MIEAVIEALGQGLVYLVFTIVMYDLFRGRTKVPVATIIQEPERHELKTVPEGYVVVRQMTYGEKQYRTNLTGAMKILKDVKSDYAGELAMETERITYWDFAHLIVDHNLEGLNDPKDPSKGSFKLDFKKVEHVKMLNPQVGEEIGTYIDEINSFSEQDQGN